MRLPNLPRPTSQIHVVPCGTAFISCLHHKAGRRRTMAHGLHMQRATIIGVRQFRVPDPSSQRTIDRTDAGNCSRQRTHSDHRRHRPSALMADVASSYCRARKLAAGGAETTTPTTARNIDGDGCSVEPTIIDPSIQMTYHGAPADPLYSSAMTRCSIGSRGSILNYMSCSDRHPFTWVVHLPKKIASLRQHSALVLNGL